MKRVQIGSGKDTVSQIAYGAWRLADDPKGTSPEYILQKIETCIDLGITSFDHADIYGNYLVEELFGKALALSPNLKNRIEIISKAGIRIDPNGRKSYDTSKLYITGQIERSLCKLGVETLDLFLIHRPDPYMDPEATASAVNKALSDGKIKNFGVSNFPNHQIEMLNTYLDRPIKVNQIELGLHHRSPYFDGTIGYGLQNQMMIMAWSPLGGGRLFEQEDLFRPCLREYAGEVDLSQLALAWLMSHPAKIVPVIGTCQIERIKHLAQAAYLELSREKWFEILELAEGHPVP